MLQQPLLNKIKSSRAHEKKGLSLKVSGPYCDCETITILKNYDP